MCCFLVLPLRPSHSVVSRFFSRQGLSDGLRSVLSLLRKSF